MKFDILGKQAIELIIDSKIRKEFQIIYDKLEKVEAIVYEFDEKVSLIEKLMKGGLILNNGNATKDSNKSKGIGIRRTEQKPDKSTMG